MPISNADNPYISGKDGSLFLQKYIPQISVCVILNYMDGIKAPQWQLQNTMEF